jgi:hypothetical protein
LEFISTKGATPHEGHEQRGDDAQKKSCTKDDAGLKRIKKRPGLLAHEHHEWQ